MSLVALLLDFVIALGSLGRKEYHGGPRFELAYVSGRPDLHQADKKGGLTIARDRLKYSKGWGDQVVFDIPFELIVSARHADPDRLVIQLSAQGASASEIHFRAAKRKEIDRFLAALPERWPDAVSAD